VHAQLAYLPTICFLAQCNCSSSILRLPSTFSFNFRKTLNRTQLLPLRGWVIPLITHRLTLKVSAKCWLYTGLIWARFSVFCRSVCSPFDGRRRSAYVICQRTKNDTRYRNPLEIRVKRPLFGHLAARLQSVELPLGDSETSTNANTKWINEWNLMCLYAFHLLLSLFARMWQSWWQKAYRGNALT